MLHFNTQLMKLPCALTLCREPAAVTAAKVQPAGANHAAAAKPAAGAAASSKPAAAAKPGAFAAVADDDMFGAADKQRASKEAAAKEAAAKEAAAQRHKVRDGSAGLGVGHRYSCEHSLRACYRGAGGVSVAQHVFLAFAVQLGSGELEGGGICYRLFHASGCVWQRT